MARDPGPDDVALTWRQLWPWALLPPIVVFLVVLWLWLGAEGGFTAAGKYTLS